MAVPCKKTGDNRNYGVQQAMKGRLVSDDGDGAVEKEWPSIDLGYPQYVYTVSGWIQVVEVASYTAKPALHVIVVPHSHQDVGWRETVDACFSSHAKSTLSNMVTKLEEHRKWKFIWAETAFLSRWYDGASDTEKQSLKRYNQEIMFDDNFLALPIPLDVKPTSSWSVDPFGHSPTMAYLLKGAGIDKMVIQRVHYAIKRHLAQSQKLEFIWRQSWDVHGSSDILCHMMPFLTYAVLYSCGPDPHICCQFDFYKDKCFRGSKVIKSEPVTDNNIKKLAWALWEQYQKKAQLYNSNVLLVPHGDDFRYDTMQEWDKQLGNMEKIMAFMNADKDMNIKIEFGTITDYFRTLEVDRKQHSKSENSVMQNHILIGDFFPYNDRDDQYWTGFYSSRPLYKFMARTLQARLRMAEIFYTLTLGHLLKSHNNNHLLLQLDSKLADLQQARHAQATFMHHDGITGTSKKDVTKDYASLLQKALSTVEELLKLLLAITVPQEEDSLKSHIKMAQEWPVATAPPVFTVANITTSMVLVTNPLTSTWVYAVKMQIADPRLRIFTLDGKQVKQQVNPVFNWKLEVSQIAFELVFEAEMPPLSVKSFRLMSVQQASKEYASLTILNLDHNVFGSGSPFKSVKSVEESFDIENSFLKATFSSCKGTLQHVMRRSDDQSSKVEIKFLMYGTGSWTNPFKDKSGAYIFLPDGPAKEQDIKYPPMVVLKGPIMWSVLTVLPGVLHEVTLYNVSGSLDAGVHVKNLVNLADSQWDNKELVMRLVSDIHSPNDDVCVDLNGFQLNRKRWQAGRLIQGNFHPVNTMAYIEDGHQMRLTLLMDQAHGLATLNSGWLEVILDRRLMQDDWRGLGEGVTDNVPTPSSFIILLEKHTKPGLKTYIGSPCRPSLLAHLLSEHLSNPPAVATLDLPAESKSPLKFDRQYLLPSTFPCTLHLVNLRALALDKEEQTQSVRGASALMILHQAGIDCGITEIYTKCDLKQTVDVKGFQDIRISRMVQTSLTATVEAKEISPGDVNVPDMELRVYKINFS
ncbi:hypothetical protein C0Q70_13846 [Pomacea canaliculata]|uniref:Alpha-mannosidase n=1 Tax=Pomacea canaliculata TaxID=400727 RepID=A0A2T7NYC0_POMCA|nr:hypothetical protein C0Q70_13846 [Pomacea canaliculata]